MGDVHNELPRKFLNKHFEVLVQQVKVQIIADINKESLSSLLDITTVSWI